MFPYVRNKFCKIKLRMHRQFKMTFNNRPVDIASNSSTSDKCDLLDTFGFEVVTKTIIKSFTKRSNPFIGMNFPMKTMRLILENFKLSALMLV